MILLTVSSLSECYSANYHSTRRLPSILQQLRREKVDFNVRMIRRWAYRIAFLEFSSP